MLGVEFRVLGPVRVLDGPVELEVPAGRLRTLLAVLLLNANQAVPVAELVDQLWEDSSPDKPRAAIQTYIGRLRRTLGDDLIHTAQHGYLLRLDPDALDLTRFRDLVNRAGQADQPADEARLLGQAIELWRGQPLVNVDSGTLASHAGPRLDEERLNATEQWMEARLQLGEHEQLVPELTTLTRDHPFRERFWTQLMLALYRCGRQADALQAYRRVHALLVDELGIEPTVPLRDLHRQILNTDPALDLPRRPARGDGLVPQQLPAGITGFTGRVDSLGRLDALLPGNTGQDGSGAGSAPGSMPICAIAGTAGVGKTTLAVHWAHRVAGRFPDGQLYVNLHGFDPARQPTPPADAIRGFLDAMRVPPQRIPASLDAQAALYRSQLADRRMLVVLDNARDADQVRPLLPGAPGCLVLVTSRSHLTGLVAAEAAHPLTLDLPAADEARQLLVGRIGRDRVDAEPEAVDQIVELCARLPLALAIVAARAAVHPGFPLAALAAELRAASGGLEAFAGADAATDVRAVFSWSYRSLGTGAARLFRLLGPLPGPDVTAPAMASLAGLPADRLRPLLAELTRTHLVTEHVPGRYTCHDLLRAYAAERAMEQESDQERRGAIHRLLDHYLYTTYHADLLLEPHRNRIALARPLPGVTAERLADQELALAWFDAEYPTLLASVFAAADGGFDTHVWQLAWTLTTFLDRRGHWHNQSAVHRVALAATRRLGDRQQEAVAHHALFRPYVRLGQDEQAHRHLGRAVRIYDEIGDGPGRARSHHDLAYLLGQQGDNAGALRHSERALDAHRATGNTFGEAGSRNAVGWYHALLGNLPEALDHCQHALDLQREVANPYGEAATLGSLGYVYHQLGRHRDAVSCYQRALSICRELGDRYYEAQALIHLGDTYDATGDGGLANRHWRHALIILDELDHPDAKDVRVKLDQLARQA